jgi:AAA domain, putative AbiEii toxin, Type IV TA system
VLRTLAAMRVYSIEPGKLRQMQEPDSGTSLKPDGSNATSVLREIERQSARDFERISDILATIVPNTKQVSVKKHGKSLSLEFTQEWGEKKRLRFEGFNMSDGTLRAIGLLAAVFQRPTPSLIAVEEPEATIHPGALESVLDVLRHASRQMQVVITTHSPDLLEAKWIEDRHLRIVEWIEGATRVAPVSEATRQALQTHLMSAGELLRSNAQSGTAVRRAGQADARQSLRGPGVIIQPIVEGQGDVDAVPLLLRRLRDEAAPLTAHLDLESAYRRCRSFRKLVTAFGALAKAAGVVPAVWPPAGWGPP